MVPELGEQVIEHDVRLNDGLAPIVLMRTLDERHYVIPPIMVAPRLRDLRMLRRVPRSLLPLRLEHTNGRVDKDSKRDEGNDEREDGHHHPQAGDEHPQGA